MSVVVAGALGMLVGLLLGAFGGGGGVVAVPALVYGLGQDARTATAGSVLVVGIVSFTGVLARGRSRTLDWRTGLVVGLAGIPAAWGGSVANRAVPEAVLLLSFAVLTVAVAVLMLVRSRSRAAGSTPVVRSRLDARRVTRLVATGVAVGFLTGFLGVGGGFLVVPALTLVLGVPIAVAVGTSLLILTLNSASAVLARVGHFDVDWSVLGPFVALAVAGALLGKVVADRVSGTVLTRAFAVLLIVVGLVVGVETLVAGRA